MLAGRDRPAELERLYQRVLAEHLAELEAAHPAPVSNVVPLRRR